MAHFTRRQFLTTSVAAGASMALGTRGSGAILDANGTVRVAVAGLNGRGGSHVSELSQIKGVQIVALIDPDETTYEGRAKEVEKKSGVKPRYIKDVREALDDPNIDAITIATPNHWHSLMTIWACQAGKDVYVEKPCSHNVHEGRVAVEAARKFNRIVQHGTQSRSDRKFAQIAEHVKQGTYGKLLVSRGLCYKNRPSIEFKENTAPPSTLDFNLWLGPAPEQPFHRNLVHYNWHWFWDFGNGDIGNQGVHQMDIARWVIPGATLPRSVLSLGGRFGYKDQGQTPNTQISVMDFGDTQLIFEVRHKTEAKFYGEGVGNTFHFQDGVIAGNKFYRHGSDKGEALAKIEAPRGPGGGHFENFIEAVRSRKQDDLNAEIQEGHYSSALCHLANVSYRMGQPVPFDKAGQAFGDNKAAYETLARTAEYLKTDVKLALDGEQVMLGKTLQIDAAKESILDDQAAAALLFREYRKPFIVPEAIA